MAKLAIKGHPTRGKEVIEILKMLGGVNQYEILDTHENLLYSIRDYDNYIIGTYPSDTFTVFTLEEFLEKFPYKVGDKLKTIYGKVGIVKQLIWGYRENQVLYELEDDVDSLYHVGTELQPYKEETMEKEISSAIIDRFICLEGYDFYDDKGNIIDTKEIIMKKKQPQYPKTYKECCEVLLLNSERATWGIEGLEYKRHLIVCFQRLLICRDAYWKIADDWHPDWQDSELKYCIKSIGADVIKGSEAAICCILAFPTEEMRDAFYENFKKLIEECKELL